MSLQIASLPVDLVCGGLLVLGSHDTCELKPIVGFLGAEVAFRRPARRRNYWTKQPEQVVYRNEPA